MPIFLDPTGRSTFGIGICARCSRKFSLEDLHPDPNAPGLRVCVDDLDEYDPYRLPPRQTEDITLRFARPDVPLTIPQEPPESEEDVVDVFLLENGEPYWTEDEQFLSPQFLVLTTEEGDSVLTEGGDVLFAQLGV